MANTDNLTSYIMIALCLGGVFILAQLSMNNLNPGGSPVFINNQGIPLCDLMGAGGCGTFNNTPDTENVLEYLPSSSASVSPTTGNIFTDSFTVIKEGLSKVSKGTQYILKTLSFPYTVMKAVFQGFNAPPALSSAFALIIATIWYGIGLFFIINWLTGR
jgi:hypothetical protein